MLIRHASKPKTDRKPDRRLHHPRQSSLYTVAACPDGLYLRGAQFAHAAVLSGLRCGNWPEGTVFVAPDARRLIVWNRALVVEGSA